MTVLDERRPAANETRERILDAAEELFGETGFAATSLRAITSEAGVNIAAVNYHFGSKDNLIIEMMLRNIRPLNAERYRMLEEAEAEYGESIPVEVILESFFRPAFDYFSEENKSSFLRVLGRSIHESGDFMRVLMEQEWNPLCRRFGDALQRSMPELDEDDIFWRFHFSLGALIHVFNLRQLKHLCTESNDPRSPEEVTQELVAFCSAGFLREGGQR